MNNEILVEAIKPIIFTRDCVTPKNHWRIPTHMTKEIVIHINPYIILYTHVTINGSALAPPFTWRWKNP